MSNNATTGLLLEVIPAYCFGLLGLGHAFAGRLGLAAVSTIAWWGYWIFAYFGSVLTLGLGAIVLIPLGFAVPVLSGLWVHNDMTVNQHSGNWTNVLIGFALALGLAVLAYILFFAGIVSLGVILSVLASIFG